MKKSIETLVNKKIENTRAIKGGNNVGDALSGAAAGGASGAVNTNNNNDIELLDEAGDTSAP